MEILYEYDSEKLLRKYGIKTPKSIITDNLEEVLKFFEENNGCVIKPANEIHKTEKGVFICKNKEEVVNAFNKLKLVYCAEILEGFELFIGGKITEFGKVMLIGWGGIYTEILKDYKCFKIPFDKTTFDIFGYLHFLFFEFRFTFGTFQISAFSF